MADTPVDIPNRAAFKASEVCEIAQIPPYVLRSWEKEFPGLGAAARPGGSRIYRREDVEQILRVKQLVFAEGLTLAGARRKIEGDVPVDELLLVPEPPGAPEEVKVRVTEARRGLKDLLDLLSAPGPGRPEAAAPAHEDVAPTWPPQKPARASAAVPKDNGDHHQRDLPLLEGAPEGAAPKARQSRRRVTPQPK